MPTRRTFIQSVAAMAAVPPPEPLLPLVKFGKTDITRMIIGSNPFYGYSHFNKILDAAMREYYTPERRVEVLQACERQGINSWQLHYNDQPREDFKRYRDAGGKMNLILLADFELMTNPALLPEVAKLGPLGIAHHGNRTDERFRAGEKGKVKDFLKRVRDTGVMVGLSTHNPNVIDITESENWDIDYYQACLYRVSRTAEEARAEFKEAPIGETYMEKDPERMCQRIRQTKKPCLAFKLFGAGRAVNSRQQIEAAFQFALTNIKPTDAVIVGMFPKYSDQVTENVSIVRKLLAT
jgi:hypothetical protein